MNKKILFNLILTTSLVVAGTQPANAENYNKAKAWAEKPATIQQPVDVFYLPTAGKIQPKELKKETAPYSTVGDIYAPVYKKPKDAQKAFETYLKNENKNRPFILAASKQSADLAVSLYNNLSSEAKKNVVAAYVPGAKPVSFKESLKKKSTTTETGSRAMRKRLEAMRLKEEQAKKPAGKTAKTKSVIITKLPTTNFEHSLMVNTEEYLENNAAYYKVLTKKYTLQAQGFLKEIENNMKVRDYGIKLRKPRDTRIFTRNIVVHHSGTPTDMDLSARAIQSMHLNNGWYGIGYHFVIRKNGTVEVGTPLQTIGAHSYMHNSNTIGIHLSGNFELANPTKAQITSLEKLIAYLAKDYHLDLSKNIVWGHRHFNTDTACPGYYLNRLLPEIRSGARAYEAKLLAGKKL